MRRGWIMPKIIAFGHRSRVGKDTSVKFLSSALSSRGRKVQHISFAAALKEISFQTYGWAGLKRGQHYETHPEDRKVVIPHLNMTAVDVWIKVGQALRGVYAGTWVDLALRTAYRADYLLISDLRFQNEINVVRELGGLDFKVNNTRAEIINSDADNNLQGFADWYGYVMNEGTLQDLNSAIVSLADDLESGQTVKGKVYGTV